MSCVFELMKGWRVLYKPVLLQPLFQNKQYQRARPDMNTMCRDTAGQERYASLAPLYYRGASAAAVVYDITSGESFQKAKHWVSELQKNASGNIGVDLCTD